MKGNEMKNRLDRLRGLFDYQRFAGNRHLAALIEQTTTMHAESLSDEDLEHVSAAGEINTARTGKKDEECNGDE